MPLWKPPLSIQRESPNSDCIFIFVHTIRGGSDYVLSIFEGLTCSHFSELNHSPFSVANMSWLRECAAMYQWIWKPPEGAWTAVSKEGQWEPPKPVLDLNLCELLDLKSALLERLSHTLPHQAQTKTDQNSMWLNLRWFIKDIVLCKICLTIYTFKMKSFTLVPVFKQL